MSRLDRGHILQHAYSLLRLIHYHAPSLLYPRRVAALYLLLAIIAPVPWSKLKEYLQAFYGSVDDLDEAIIKKNGIVFGFMLDCLEEVQLENEEETEECYEWCLKIKKICKKMTFPPFPSTAASTLPASTSSIIPPIVSATDSSTPPIPTLSISLATVPNQDLTNFQQPESRPPRLAFSNTADFEVMRKQVLLLRSELEIMQRQRNNAKTSVHSQTSNSTPRTTLPVTSDIVMDSRMDRNSLVTHTPTPNICELTQNSPMSVRDPENEAHYVVLADQSSETEKVQRNIDVEKKPQIGRTDTDEDVAMDLGTPIEPPGSLPATDEALRIAESIRVPDENDPVTSHEGNSRTSVQPPVTDGTGHEVLSAPPTQTPPLASKSTEQNITGPPNLRTPPLPEFGAPQPTNEGHLTLPDPPPPPPKTPPLPQPSPTGVSHFRVTRSRSSSKDSRQDDEKSFRLSLSPSLDGRHISITHSSDSNNDRRRTPSTRTPSTRTISREASFRPPSPKTPPPPPHDHHHDKGNGKSSEEGGNGNLDRQESRRADERGESTRRRSRSNSSGRSTDSRPRRYTPLASRLSIRLSKPPTNSDIPSKPLDQYPPRGPPLSNRRPLSIDRPSPPPSRIYDSYHPNYKDDPPPPRKKFRLEILSPRARYSQNSFGGGEMTDSNGAGGSGGGINSHSARGEDRRNLSRSSPGTRDAPDDPSRMRRSRSPANSRQKKLISRLGFRQEQDKGGSNISHSKLENRLS